MATKKTSDAIMQHGRMARQLGIPREDNPYSSTLYAQYWVNGWDSNLPVASRPPIGTPNENFANNDIQFPRLISELQAAGAFTPEIVKALEDSMDLGEAIIFEIVERADTVWEDVKSRTKR